MSCKRLHTHSCETQKIFHCSIRGDDWRSTRDLLLIAYKQLLEVGIPKTWRIHTTPPLIIDKTEQQCPTSLWHTHNNIDDVYRHIEVVRDTSEVSCPIWLSCTSLTKRGKSRTIIRVDVAQKDKGRLQGTRNSDREGWQPQQVTSYRWFSQHNSVVISFPNYYLQSYRNILWSRERLHEDDEVQRTHKHWMEYHGTLCSLRTTTRPHRTRCLLEAPCR